MDKGRQMNCPHCGAAGISGETRFDCGTNRIPGALGTIACYERQIAALKDEIKRAAHELWCEGANGRDGFRSEWIADWNNSRAKQIAEG